MKKNICALILFLSCINAFAQEYTLNGKVNNPVYNGSKVYLQAIEKGDKIYSPKTLDSTIVTNGSFSFRDAAETVDIRIVSLSPSEKANKLLGAIFIAEPGKIDITLDSIAIVNGSVENEKHKIFTEDQRKIYDQMKSVQKEAILLQADGKLTEEKAAELENKFIAYQQQLSNISFEYIKNNINSRVGEFYFIALAESFLPEQLITLYNLSGKEFQESAPVKNMMAELAPLTAEPYNGGQFKDVELSTPDGKKASVSDYVGKGKVVLIDFWASWCSPCRKDMPRLVELYKEYKDKDFEILGISLDENLSSWVRAIESMKITWPNLSDLGGWRSKAARIYEVKSIPQSFLVDKKGNIVGHNLKGLPLKYKIEELLKEE